jgi:DNA-binding NarL/FixJ family response regulator
VINREPGSSDSQGVAFVTSLKPTIRILAVDDHPVFRAGLAALINNELDMKVVGEASDGREAVEQFDSLRPDVTLLDLQMSGMNGIDAIHLIRSTFLSARIVVVSAHCGDVLAHRALSAGAQAYVSKSMIRKDLLETIRAVRNGLKRVSQDVATELAQHMGEDSISNRESEVLNLVALGNSNKRIAKLLSISEETVKGHIKRIMGKLDARDRTHAVTLGVARGIIQLSLPGR